MQTDVLIVGGGLSGLAAAWQLQRAGVEVHLLEARARFGGRAFTVEDDGGANCDLGPSWFWPGQPLVAGLLNHFEIPVYEQYAEGAILLQQADGRIVRSNDPSPMAGSLRIEGGLSRLVAAMSNEIEPTRRFLQHVVTGLAINDEMIAVDVAGPAGTMPMQARQVAIAIPPRLAANLTFAPALPAQALRTLTATPTWMAGHAKFFAVYEQPFWREMGLCGTAISRRGPLAEIHDASPPSGSAFCLFGFAGLDAASRARMGQAEFTRQATLQLAALFGDAAHQPTAIYFQDWSREEFTASAADRQPQTRHPQYGLTLQPGSAWAGKLDFISSETSHGNGGLIEGALAAGLRFARRISGSTLPLAGEPAVQHSASMSWDWL